MHCRKTRCCAILLATLTLAGWPLHSLADEAADVRLVVLISVDQLRGDYLTRWAPHFEGGFARLLDDGALCTNAHISYGATATAAGHATIATGRLPRQHGIIANKWYLEPGVTTQQQPVDDPDQPIVGLAEPPKMGASPWRLIGETLGDRMKLADRRSRVYAVALKDRAAIFLGGKRPDAAYWWHARSGFFISSEYYMPSLPTYVRDMNEQGFAAQFAGQSWKPLLPAEHYAGTRPIDPAWGDIFTILGHEFPHILPAADSEHFAEALRSSPFGNDLVLELARRILDNEQLGKGDAPDLLCIGLSSNDYVGHVYGPESAEVLDMTVRTDRQLGAFLDELDAKIGLNHCLIVLTADHGVASPPQIYAQMGLPGGFLKPREVRDPLDSVLRDALGDRAPDGPLVLGVKMPWVFVDPAFDRLDGASNGELTRIALDYLRGVEGLGTVFATRDLEGPPPPEADVERRLAWNAYHRKRSGRFYIKLAPYWHTGGDLAGHNGGTLSDRHVPIAFLGSGVRPGRIHSPARLVDVAVTTAALLGIEPPEGAVGSVLHAAMDGVSPRPEVEQSHRGNG